MKFNITYNADRESYMIEDVLSALAPFITERDRLKFKDGEKYSHVYLTISTPTADNPLMDNNL